MAFAFSKHSLEQMKIRGISLEMVLAVLANPEQILEQENKKIFQSRIKEGENNWLLRIFVNSDKEPQIVITVYKTSKISKYNEGQV